MQDVIDTAKKLRIPENVDFNGSNQNGVGKYQVRPDYSASCV